MWRSACRWRSPPLTMPAPRFFSSRSSCSTFSLSTAYVRSGEYPGPLPELHAETARLLRAHQASRGVAHRLHGGDRHVPGHARGCFHSNSSCRDRRDRLGRRRSGGDQLPGRAEDRRGDAAHALAPATPQNIVIGGASGAMPPVLGWAAVTGEVTTEAMLLFLIIFAWTPPHFWSLALYRTEDYARAGVPMLPVTHGKQYTRLQVLLYTLILFAVTLLPYVVRMSGWLYLGAAIALGGVFVAYALRIYFAYSDFVAQKTFRYSIAYLAALFAALLLDHYL